MHYFVGAIFLVFLLFILPTTAILAISVFFIISALIVQTSAAFVTKSKVPFSKSIKAVIYSLIFTVIACGFTSQLASATSSSIIFLLPVFIFIAQALAYSIALDIDFVGSIAISVCILVVGWLVQLVFGLSATTFRLFS